MPMKMVIDLAMDSLRNPSSTNENAKRNQAEKSAGLDKSTAPEKESSLLESSKYAVNVVDICQSNEKSVTASSYETDHHAFASSNKVGVSFEIEKRDCDETCEGLFGYDDNSRWNLRSLSEVSVCPDSNISDSFDAVQEETGKELGFIEISSSHVQSNITSDAKSKESPLNSNELENLNEYSSALSNDTLTKLAKIQDRATEKEENFTSWSDVNAPKLSTDCSRDPPDDEMEYNNSRKKTRDTISGREDLEDGVGKPSLYPLLRSSPLTEKSTPRSSNCFSWHNHENNDIAVKEQLHQRSSLRSTRIETSIAVADRKSVDPCLSSQEYGKSRKKVVTVVSPRSFPQTQKTDFKYGKVLNRTALDLDGYFPVNNEGTLVRLPKVHEEPSQCNNDDHSVTSQRSAVSRNGPSRDTFNEYGDAKNRSPHSVPPFDSCSNEATALGDHYCDEILPMTNIKSKNNDSRADEECCGVTPDCEGSLQSCFTEKIEASDARMAVKEMINSEGCNLSGGIVPSNYVPQIKDQYFFDDQTDDRSVVSQHSTASRRSCYERYAVPDDGDTSAVRLRKKITRSQQERSTYDDDESVCTTGSRRKGARHNAVANNDDESVCTTGSRRRLKSRDGRYNNDDDDSVYTTGSRSSLQTMFQREFSHFRQRLANTFHGQQHVEYFDGLHQLLKDDVEALITKHRRDNRLLSRKYYHEKQKSETAQNDLILQQEELRNLKHELRLMDAERDEIEEKIDKLKAKEERYKFNDERAQAEILRLKGLLRKSEDAVNSLTEKLANEAKADSEKKTPSGEVDFEVLKKANSELLAENANLNQRLIAAESKVERAAVLKDLLNEINRSREVNETSNITGTNEYKEKMLAMETKLSAAKTIFDGKHECNDKFVEMEKKLFIANDTIAALEKSIEVKERAMNSILEEIAELKGSSVLSNVSLQNEIVALNIKLSEYETAESVRVDVFASLQDARMSVKCLEEEKIHIHASYHERINDLEKELLEKGAELKKLKEELDRLECIRTNQEKASKESIRIIQNYQSQIADLERQLIEKHDQVLRDRGQLEEDFKRQFKNQEESFKCSVISLQRMMSQVKKEKHELEQLLDETSYELEITKSNLSKTMKENSDLEHALDETSFELDALVDHNQKCEQLVDEQSQEVQNLLKEIAIINEANENLSEEIEKIRTHGKNIEDELSKRLETVIVLEKSTSMKDQTIARLREESEDLKLQILSLKTALYELQKKFDSQSETSHTEMEVLRNELSNHEKSLESRKFAIEEMSRELSELQKTHSSKLVSIGKGVEEKLLEKDKEIEKLTAALSACEISCKSMENDMLIMRNEMLSIDDDRLNESKVLENLKTDLLNTQKRKNELEKRVEDMGKLLLKAESIIARTNTITLSSVMVAMRNKE